MSDSYLEERVPEPPEPDEGRVRTRAEALAEEQSDIGVEDPEAEAKALLRDSKARKDRDPAVRDLEDGRVERRLSEQATPPPPP